MASNFNSKNVNMNELTQWLEGGVFKDYINYHNYNEFKNIKFIGFGGFGKVYQATWASVNTVVALKLFENNKTVIKEIVNEVNEVMYVHIFSYSIILTLLFFYLDKIDA
jgi:serine/threonine protein kinase